MIPPRPPRMDFEHADLHERQKPFRILDINVLAWAVLLSDRYAPQRTRCANAGVLLKKAFSRGLTFGAANETQRPIDKMWQDPSGDLCVVIRQTQLRQPGIGIENTLRMRQFHGKLRGRSFR